MKIPKTPIAFDYDLWTTEDGKCMVRVKRTGEVSEVDRKVMRILRAEEKRIRRSYGSDNTSEDEDGAEKISDTVLSLDAMPEDDVKSAASVSYTHLRSVMCRPICVPARRAAVRHSLPSRAV